ncbi:MobA/MobL family protein (plasmid) [Peteryoungia desertarenae]|uniref:MobA/MobL family protein n=1 Tax=Peteryoungia desertarenae TaxID=1813451 RepID=A0ABX6QUX1_9HYPH|nr:MobQ family relaxase [Peteryoungia desertarenae]QLF72060.1 MobA/MobL family protein [Peteryoungia desertarenae]
MAIFHLHVKNISRGDGRSAVAAAAYRAGETLPNDAEERESVFGGRRDVLHAVILCPAGAPSWMADRATLWNAVEAAERRKDARLAKEIEAALPRELTPAGWLELARSFAAHYAGQGFVADFAIHDDGSAHNPHMHLLLTTRTVEARGFGGKIRSADGRQFVEEARLLWAKLVNAALQSAGLGVSVDPRSHAAAGLAREPGQHRGPDPAERRARRKNMGLSRLFPSKVAPEGEGSDRLRDWPASQLARGYEDEGQLPVPGPDGSLLSQRELDEAQDRMLTEVERQPREDAAGPVGRRWATGENAGQGQPEPERPLVARRWASEAPRTGAEVSPDALTARRWTAEQPPERTHDIEREDEWRDHERDRRRT